MNLRKDHYRTVFGGLFPGSTVHQAAARRGPRLERSPSGAKATRVGERDPSAGLSDAVQGRSSHFFFFQSRTVELPSGSSFVSYVEETT